MVAKLQAVCSHRFTPLPILSFFSVLSNNRTQQTFFVAAAYFRNCGSPSGVRIAAQHGATRLVQHALASEVIENK